MIESEAYAEFARLLHRHVCPSVQIGCGKARATAQLKFHAVTHALRLLVPSLGHLDRLFKSIFVFWSDQGTESVFSRLRPNTPWLDLVPASEPTRQEPLQEVDFLDEPEVECHEVDLIPEIQAQAPEPVDIACLPESECVADVSASLEVDDLLHCIHNATKGLSAAMKHFDTVVEQCKKLADLLRKKRAQGTFG